MPEEKADLRLDLIGKVCPYPTVKTNGTLKKMAAGEVLEVITDYYPERIALCGASSNAIGAPNKAIIPSPVISLIVPS